MHYSRSKLQAKHLLLLLLLFLYEMYLLLALRRRSDVLGVARSLATFGWRRCRRERRVVDEKRNHPGARRRVGVRLLEVRSSLEKLAKLKISLRLLRRRKVCASTHELS